MTGMFIVGGTLFVVLYFMVMMQAMRTVKKCSRDELSCAEQFFFQERLFIVGFVYFAAFMLFSYFLAAITVSAEQMVHVPSVVGVWLFLFLVATALFYYCFRRAISYASLEALLDRVEKICQKAAIRGHEETIFALVDSLVESATKAIYKKNSRLCRAALQKIVIALQDYIRASTGKSVRVEDIPLLDRANSFTAYVLRLAEWLLQIAKEQKLQPISEEIISSYGKMAVAGASCHTSLISMPLIFLERAIHTYQDDKDLLVRAAATLSQVAKSLVDISLEKKVSMKEMIILTLSHLEEIVKMYVMRDKTTNPAVLMQPFAEVGDLIAEDRYIGLIDREDILRELKRCLVMFNALDMIPPVEPPFTEDK